MATARAINAAERKAEQAKKEALLAHKALDAATTRDRRTMAFAPNQERIAFEKLDAAARAADAKADAACERLERLRAGNGKAKAKANGREKATQTTALQDALTARRKVKAAKQRKQAAIDASYG